jgi:hypothetical protein
MSEYSSGSFTTRCSILFLFLLIACSAHAQEDLNLNELRKNAQQSSANPQRLKYQIVDVQEKNGIFTLTYDLNESVENEYSVDLYLFREKDSKFSLMPKACAGDVGRGMFSGNQRKIIWDSKKDLRRELDGNDYYFVLNIKKIEPSHFPWIWVGIGGAAAGAAVYLLTRSSDNSGSGSSSAELPAINISRPQ